MIEGLEDIIDLRLKQQGCFSARVDDGQVLIITKELLTKLLQRADPAGKVMILIQAEVKS